MLYVLTIAAILILIAINSRHALPTAEQARIKRKVDKFAYWFFGIVFAVVALLYFYGRSLEQQPKTDANVTTRSS